MPAGQARRHRVVLFLADAEYEKLEALAERGDQPLATVAYELLAEALGRRRVTR